MSQEAIPYKYAVLLLATLRQLDQTLPGFEMDDFLLLDDGDYAVVLRKDNVKCSVRMPTDFDQMDFEVAVSLYSRLYSETAIQAYQRQFIFYLVE